jgi:phenylpropionate dioxygenase-like ring-hydroxylating dioxygenase large terminal subunit
MGSILNYLGFGATTAVPADKTPILALPASWYTSPEMYELEKRAIFTKKWLLITHKVRFSQPGDWLKFEVAGYEFILCRSRKEEGKIHGFHNVCRHRAYPLVEGTSGCARIFACRYHGWSYGLDGKLAKAPQYDELTGFDKAANSLFPIHVKIDAKGFVWVNLDRSPDPEPWETEFANVDMQERYNQYNFDDYVFSHEYAMEGEYNWKILADNFNECYHCPTTHPTIPQLADITTHDVKVERGFIMHQSVPTEQQKKDGCAISSTYYCPNTSLSVL